MSRTKKTHYALLGLLSWKPMSGYDIKKIVDMGLSHFWNENYGQIYPTLAQLVRDGLATKTSDSGSGKRARNLYRITPQGEQAFRDWLAEPTAVPTVRNELQLKFFLGSKQPVRQSVQLIRGYRKQQQAQLVEYQLSEQILRQAIASGDYPTEVAEIFDGHDRPPTAKQKAKQCRIFLLTLRHGILAVEARIQWCDEVLQELTS